MIIEKTTLGKFLGTVKFGTKIVCINADTDVALYVAKWWAVDENYPIYKDWFVVQVTAKDDSLVLSLTQDVDNYYKTHLGRLMGWEKQE